MYNIHQHQRRTDRRGELWGRTISSIGRLSAEMMMMIVSSLSSMELAVELFIHPVLAQAFDIDINPKRSSHNPLSCPVSASNCKGSRDQRYLNDLITNK
jgi:hypothetical protein